MNKYCYSFFSLLIIIGFVISCIQTVALAQTTVDIKQQIDQRNQDIANLEKEIAGYQAQINTLDTQANSLYSTIKSLQLTQKKLADNIKVTENKIAEQNLEIVDLSVKIVKHTDNISDDKKIIINTFNVIQERDDISIFDILLGSKSISQVISSLDELGVLQSDISSHINDLSKAKAGFESTKTSKEQARANLVALNKQLNDQKAVVVSTATAENKLLKDTKQSEIQYQAILAEKARLKDSFENELLNLQSQLKNNVDPNKLPSTGSGVLSWPLDSITITQYFGNTSFSTANPQIYNGKGHTGVDFRAAIGTPVKAALTGVVSGIGNTDLVSGCYSFGKWVMIKHNNGLSTLYAHLSVQSVAVGSAVTTGQIIGYSGNTGYTTGPHLHFGVYATQGVVIGPLINSKNCHNAIIPVAPFEAYLNPLSYL